MNLNKMKKEYDRIIVDHKFTELSGIAIKHLGMNGRMLYQSKSLRQPTTIFNANIFNDEAKKIWFGDLEIDLDREALLKISAELGTIYILREGDGRFLREIPTITQVRLIALVTIKDGEVHYSNYFEIYVEYLKQK